MLDAYHQGLIDGISRYFGDSLNTVSAYFPKNDNENKPNQGILIKTPAALIDIEMLDGVNEIGDGRDSIQCHVSIHCVLGSQTENLQQQLRNFSAEMMQQIKNKRFGTCHLAGHAEEITALPGYFKKEKTGYDSWVVSFIQSIYLGEVDQPWGTGVDFIPQEVFFSRAPEIGLEHIDDYRQVVKDGSIFSE